MKPINGLSMEQYLNIMITGISSGLVGEEILTRITAAYSSFISLL
jgi:hypothetical protein